MPPSDEYCSIPKHFNGEEMTQECHELLLSLPTEKGWSGITYYQYQGFWYPSLMLEGTLSYRKHFQPHPSDFLLGTAPKSGTTWLKALLFAVVNRNSHPPSSQNHPLLENNPHSLVPFMENDYYLHLHNRDLPSTSTSPRLFSTHLPYASLPKSVLNSTCKIVYLCRDPKDNFVSLWHFMNNQGIEGLEEDSLEDAFDMFCRGVSVCGPFWDHVVGYCKESLRSPERVMFLKYEEMKERPATQLRKLAGFLGCPFMPEEEGVVEEILGLCSFGSLSKVEVNKSGKMPSGVENKALFRRGEAGDWKNHLTAEMAERMDNISKEKLGGSGLSFEFN